MKFKYVSYDSMLIDGIEKNAETIYVFSDYTLKNALKKNIKKNIFEEEPLYLTFEEFKEMIYRTDKVVLTDIKRYTTLYDSLKKEFLKLNMSNYFESIEFSKLFFNYFAELNRAMILSKIKVEKWQENYLEIFYTLKKGYDKYLKKINAIPSDWIENIENFNISLIKNYKKIVFIDIVKFSKLDREIIGRLSTSFELEFILQGEKGFFDEESLEIKKVVLPKKQRVKFEILEVRNELELAINVLNMQEKKKGISNIYSPESETNIYYKLFPNNFIKSGFSILNETNFYKFLVAKYEVIKGIDSKIKDYISIEKFLEFTRIDIVREYYELGREEIEYLNGLVEDGNRYIGNEKNEKLDRIYREIIRVSKFKLLEEFIIYFNHILEHPKMYEDRYEDFYEKIQEYMGYAKTTKQLLTKSCLKNKGDLLRLILQYFNNVELKRIEDNENKYLIKPLSNVKAVKTKEAIFINISNKYFSKNKDGMFFLTEHQKKEYGFISLEKEREVEKYRFYQDILKNKQNIIVYIKNELTGERESSLLMELLNSYSYTKLENSISSEIVLNSIFNLKTQKEFLKNNIFLPKDREDFGTEMRLGAYQFEALNSCFYRYYLQYIIGLETKEISEIEPISSKFLGVYIHNVFEKLTNKMWKKVLNGDYFIDEEELGKLLYDEYKKNRKKIPSSLEIYFFNVIIPKFKRNILTFYKKLEEDYADKKITRIESEKSKKNDIFFRYDDIDVKLNGRVDLIVETDMEKHIFDFKTGGKNKTQLDFYSIMLYGDEEVAKKTIYNAFDGKDEKLDKIELTKDDLKESLKKFFEATSYELADKKSNCGYCRYENICRKEF